MVDNEQNKPGDEEQAAKNLWQLLNEPQPSSKPEAPSSPSVLPGGDGPTRAPADEEPAPRELHPENYIPQDSDPVTPVSTDISQIQKILLNPDALDEDFEYRPAEEAEEDFDRAIKDFYRSEAIVVSCKNHPEVDAADRCPECEAYYCQACMVIRRGRLLCRDCSESLFTPTEEEILTAREMGRELPEPEVTPESYPEFQVGRGLMGLEGAPASPVKRLLALALDLLVTRSFLSFILFIVGAIFTGTNSQILQLFHAVPDESTLFRVVKAFFLYSPVMPWLIIMAVVDFLYFFLTLSFNNRTFGMSWTGCRLVTEWGDYVSFGAVGLRTLIFMVCLGWPAIILGFFFPAFRGPHDYAAGTLVINYAGVKRIDAYETVQIKL